MLELVNMLFGNVEFGAEFLMELIVFYLLFSLFDTAILFIKGVK